MTGVRRRHALFAAFLIIFVALGIGNIAASTAAPRPRPIVTAVHGVEPTPGLLRVTVQGAAFTHVRRVVIAGAVASRVQVASPQKLVATVVDLGNGFGHVRVVTSHGTSPTTSADLIAMGQLRNVTGLAAHPSATSVRLTWTNSGRGVVGVVVRRGTVHFPSTVHDGVGVSGVKASSHSVVDKGLRSVTRYRYSVFVRYAGRGYAQSVAHRTVKTHAGNTAEQAIVGALITAALLAGVFLLGLIPPSNPIGVGAQAAVGRGPLTGKDNRRSTSKAAGLIWTAVLLYFVITMAFVAGFDMSRFSSLVGKIDKLYLVLIGGPLAAAATAKIVALGQSATRTTAITAKARDLVSDDDGEIDLADTQYLLFNAVTAAIVLVQFAHSPASGPPVVPGILATLMGVSAATYTANKAR